MYIKRVAKPDIKSQYIYMKQKLRPIVIYVVHLVHSKYANSNYANPVLR